MCASLQSSAARRALINLNRLTLSDIIRRAWLTLHGLLATLDQAVSDMLTQPLDNASSSRAVEDASI